MNNKKHSMTYELLFPLSKYVVDSFKWFTSNFSRMYIEPVMDAWDRHETERMRKLYIHDRMEALTDHTLLDRIAAGEVR